MTAIDVALARRLVDAQFPQWSDLPIEPVEVDGWDKRTFRLGEALSLRLPSGEWYAKQVAKEQRWLPELAPRLPLPIPRPVAQGAPGDGYPYPWSVYRWLDGELAARARIDDMERFASDLAGFLNTLGRIDATDGPAPASTTGSAALPCPSTRTRRSRRSTRSATRSTGRRASASGRSRGRRRRTAIPCGSTATSR